MQYADFIALLLNRHISWFLPRRPAERPITAHLLRLQLIDITHDNQPSRRLASAPFSNAH
jgi:hypothetical protein